MGKKRRCKGIWIPIEIWDDPNLTLQEKHLLAELDSLDREEGCFASNSYFAQFLGVSENTISAIITKLKKLNYVYVQGGSRGPNRVLRSNFEFTLNTQPSVEQDSDDVEFTQDLGKVDPEFTQDLGEVYPNPTESLPKILEGFTQDSSFTNIYSNTINNTINNTVNSNTTKKTQTNKNNFVENYRKNNANSNLSKNKKVKGEQNLGALRPTSGRKPTNNGNGVTTILDKARKYILKCMSNRPIDKQDVDRIVTCLLDLCEHFTQVRQDISLKQLEKNIDEMFKICLNVDDMETLANELIRRGFYSVKWVETAPIPPKQTAVSVQAPIEFEKGEVY